MLGLRWSTFALSSNSSSRFDRKLAKAVSKLDLFALRESPKILIVDGDNVRGTARFDWSHVEVQCRIDAYCRQLPIDYSVVVWDHGSCPFVSQVTPSCTALFSGLSKRADDVIVREVDRLLSIGKRELRGEASVVVVTNDKGLTGRLRGKVTEIAKAGETCPPMLLTMDSTRFTEILRNIDVEPFVTKRDQVLHKTMEDAKDLFYQYRTRLRGSFDKRETTWERAVLAELLRRLLMQQQQQQNSQHLGQDTFVSQYLQDLESRGYYSVASFDPNSILQQSTNIFHGPTRLDRRQKKAMAKFNAMIKVNSQD